MLDKEYTDLANEVEALTDIRTAVATAFSMQQQKISDLNDKIAFLQGPGSGANTTEQLAGIKADVEKLHELNALFRMSIPANTEQPAPQPEPDPAPAPVNNDEPNSEPTDPAPAPAPGA